jgi:ubiquinone/menaquinone biosynthesis C-methylase UbiE
VKTAIDDDVIIEAFTELAPRYEIVVDRELRAFWNVSYADFVSRMVELADVKAADVVLDVATGTARIPLEIAHQGGQARRIAGLDITPSMLKHGQTDIEASRLTQRIKLVCASAANMPFVDGMFDVCICGLGMHHMDVAAVLSEMRRVLKDGGRIVVGCVAAPGFWRTPLGRAMLRLVVAVYQLTHRSARAQAEVAALPNVRTAAEWRTLLADSGFGTPELGVEFRGSRPWYPAGLTFTPTKGGR